MKRIKVIFAAGLLFIAMPSWRWMDYITLLPRLDGFYALAFFLWGLILLVLPAWLIRPRILPHIVFILVTIGSFVSYHTGTLSKMASKDPSHSHCGPLTFTGIFYPALSLFTQAPADDLEVRNQLCWVRKMITKVPDSFDSKDDLDAYLNLMQQRLLLPDNKYRASLPLLAFFYLVVYANYDGPTPSKNVQHTLEFVGGLKFWIEQYTVEISNRNYAWWDFPYGPWIQLEYGLIEENWEWLINNIVIQEP